MWPADVAVPAFSSRCCVISHACAKPSALLTKLYIICMMLPLVTTQGVIFPSCSIDNSFHWQHIRLFSCQRQLRYIRSIVTPQAFCQAVCLNWLLTNRFLQANDTMHFVVCRDIYALLHVISLDWPKHVKLFLFFFLHYIPFYTLLVSLFSLCFDFLFKPRQVLFTTANSRVV